LSPPTRNCASRCSPCRRWRCCTAAPRYGPGPVTSPAAATKHSLWSLARRWHDLDAEIRNRQKLLAELTTALVPQLVDAFGIGPDTAPELLIVAGDNIDRVRSEPAWARLCGVAPDPASSGITTRHRLNRGGHRQANAALYRSVNCPHATPPAHPRLRRPTHLRGQDQGRNHPLPQEASGPRDLGAAKTTSRTTTVPPGGPLDGYRSVNGLAESFFATLDTELFLHEHGGRFDTHHQARLAIFDWMEAFYNRRRRHSALGHLSPEAFEQQHLTAAA